LFYLFGLRDKLRGGTMEEPELSGEACWVRVRVRELSGEACWMKMGLTLIGLEGNSAITVRWGWG